MLRTARPFATAATLALIVSLTAAAAWLWAHEGHDALPTKGTTPVKDKDGRVVGVNLAPESLQALAVAVAEVAPVALDDYLDAPATVVAPWDRHAFVTSRLAGKVKAVKVRPGETISKGQVVAEVESLELADLQRELLDARSEAALSQKNVAALEESARSDLVPKEVVAEARAQHRLYLDALDIARRKLLGVGVPAGALEGLLRERDSIAVAFLAVTAPIGGVAVHVDVGPGQVVEPGDHLLEVVDLARVWVKVSVLETDLHRVAVGQDVELSFPAAPSRGAGWAGRVEAKGRSLDAQTYWGTAWTELDNPDGRLLPGMAGQARVRLPSSRPGLLVPAEAVLGERADRFVLVEVAPGQYRRQNVVVETQQGGRVQVARNTGLFPGDRVVTDGGHELAPLFAQGVLRLSPEAGVGIGLVVRPVKRESVAETVTLAAVVDLPPSARATVSARLAGTLHFLAVSRDQEVEAGQKLAEVYSPELPGLQLELLRADSQARLLDAKVQRLRPLSGSTVALQTLREMESALAAARQRREALRGKLRSIGLTLADLRDLVEDRKVVESVPVYAPVRGTVVRFRATLGQAVKPEDPLFEMHDLTQTVLRAVAPEGLLPVVRVSQKARVRLAADPAFLGRAAVRRIAPAVGALSRTIPVWADFQERPSTPPLPGMMARLTLVKSESAATLAVPGGAVVRDGVGAYVFVCKGGPFEPLKENVFERRPVETGRSDDQFVEIVAGLTEGEEVAVRGAADLQTAFANVQ